MQTAKKPFETIYLYLTGFDTQKDGMVMAIFTMDAYSQYAFQPILDKQQASDVGLKHVIKKAFDNILQEYKPDIHPETVTFITNFPIETKGFISDLIPFKHKIIFNATQTKKALKPLISGIIGS